MLCIAFFSERSLLENYLYKGDLTLRVPDVGLIFGGTGRLLASQVVGVFAIIAWSALVTASLMLLLKVRFLHMLSSGVLWFTCSRSNAKNDTMKKRALPPPPPSCIPPTPEGLGVRERGGRASIHSGFEWDSSELLHTMADVLSRMTTCVLVGCCIQL